MREHSVPRAGLVLLSAAAFVCALVVNALAGAGKGPFHSGTGNVSARYPTDITPAGWTFSIWGLIYTWLTMMVVYLTSFVFQGSWAQCLLPCSFYCSWIFNLLMNITWLLLWDRELMLAALVVLMLMVISCYSCLVLCCFATDYYGLWLRTYHRRNLACLRILVLNGLALYATWTTIASLLNLSVVLQLWGLERSTAATLSLCVLFAELVAWFILENWVLDRWVRDILTVYPVVIFALSGIIYQHFTPPHPTPNSVFTVVQLVLACIFLVSKLCTVVWRNKWRPLFSPGSARLMVSPLDGK
ncbi:uncharacterized protein ACNS7B_020354 [Menidia menidia]